MKRDEIGFFFTQDGCALRRQREGTNERRNGGIGLGPWGQYDNGCPVGFWWRTTTKSVEEGQSDTRIEGSAFQGGIGFEKGGKTAEQKSFQGCTLR